MNKVRNVDHRVLSDEWELASDCWRSLKLCAQ